MSHRMSAARSRGARAAVAAAPPEPPEASFWLERTPLPTARRGGAPAPAPGARSALTPPSTVCPKCDSPLSPSESACPSCGLRRAMFGRFRASHGDRVPAALEQLWRQVESQWSDPELHERFLSQVSLCGAYAYAASRYRRAARQRQSDAISKLQLERLSRMVHAVMAVSAVRKDERGARPYRGVIALLVLLVAAGGIGSLYMFHKRGSQAKDDVPTSITIKRGRSLGPDGKAARAFGGLRAAGARGARRAGDPDGRQADAGADEIEPEEMEAEGEEAAAEE
ncbi:MAG TPA: zinc ribbon domain-containing protein [Kofleriaceae bacterium]|nr:zinc ribbon domain-containing protein [Kofleriaceae bacterium]